MSSEKGETRECHAARHADPAKFKGSCARCKFLHYKQTWKKRCTFEDMLTQKKLSWLSEQPHDGAVWGVGCVVCSRAKKNNKMARHAFGRELGGQTLQNLQRHAASLDHVDAVQQWNTARVAEAQAGLV